MASEESEEIVSPAESVRVPDTIIWVDDVDVGSVHVYDSGERGIFSVIEYHVMPLSVLYASLR